MKKRSVIIVGIIFSLILFTSCKKTEDVYEKLHKHLSYAQTSLFVANDEDIDISLSSYIKEENFIADGKTVDVINLNTLLIKPKKSELLNTTYSYKLVGDIGSIEGDLEKTHLGISFKTNVDNLEEIGNIKSLTLYFLEKEQEYELTNILKDHLSYKNIVIKSYQQLQDIIPIDNFNREIYIKLIYDDKENNSNYYWYVSYLIDTENFNSFVIDLNGKIISSKKGAVAKLKNFATPPL